MITELFIQNFKGISECRLRNLGQINIFIGKNDSCKSSILEAASTTFGESHFGFSSGLGNVISRRSNLPVGGREIFYGYDTTQQIKCNVLLNGRIVSMTASYDSNNNQISATLAIRGLDGKSSESSVVYSSNYGTDFSFRGGSGGNLIEVFPKEEQKSASSYLRNFRFIDSSSRNDLRLIEDLLGKIKFIGKDVDFGKFLFEIFGSGLKWEFLPHPDFPNQYRVTLIENQKRIFLNGLGDGVRFGMLIIANSMLSNDTVLFIEEIECNQHPESLKKLIPFLIEISKKNKLQLFITTHNPMVWSCFEKGFATEAEKDSVLRVFHVKRDSLTGYVNCILQTKKDADKFFSDVDKDLYGWKEPSNP
jgi:hypothetical protein